VLLVGTLASAVLFAAGFVAGLAGNEGVGALLSNVGVLAILATPAAALVATAAESRTLQPQVMWLAFGVLAVLAVAVGVALFAH
jgi:hypothetical protein